MGFIIEPIPEPESMTGLMRPLPLREEGDRSRSHEAHQLISSSSSVLDRGKSLDFDQFQGWWRLRNAYFSQKSALQTHLSPGQRGGGRLPSPLLVAELSRLEARRVFHERPSRWETTLRKDHSGVSSSQPGRGSPEGFEESAVGIR